MCDHSVDSWLRNNKMNRVGMVTVELHGNQETARLQLADDWLSLVKEEIAYTYSPIDKVDPILLTKERVVEIVREKVGGLGLSVKGGAEHNLPILISRIFKDQAADKTGQLFVGDAILKVNGVELASVQHDAAVQCLKRAGDVATLTVKYFRPASLFLSQQRKGGGTQAVNADGQTPAISDEVFQPEQQWVEIINMHLQCAYITKYVPGTDEPRSCGFELMSMENRTTGAIYVDNTQLQAEWIQSIMDAITRTNHRFIEVFNKTTVAEQQLQHMCWVCERSNMAAPSGGQTWFKKFLTFRGSDVCLYETPPVKNKNWRRFEASYKIYECMFRILKNDELEDDRTFCFVIETGLGSIHYLSVETRQEILQLEKAWNWANFNALRQLKNKTYGCMWHGKVCGITLDLHKGFALYDGQEKNYVWSYKFSQLKGSSDDGRSKLKLHFLNDAASAIEMRELDCTNIRTIMFAIQAFLCGKLACVDPSFLLNT